MTGFWNSKENLFNLLLRFNKSHCLKPCVFYLFFDDSWDLLLPTVLDSFSSCRGMSGFHHLCRQTYVLLLLFPSLNTSPVESIRLVSALLQGEAQGGFGVWCDGLHKCKCSSLVYLRVNV